MKPLFVLGLLMPLAVHAGLPEFEAKYDLERGRFKVGETVMRLERTQDDVWRYTTEAEAVGFLSLFVDDVIKEESVFRYEDGRFWPLSYEYRQLNSSKNRDTTINYNWTDGTADVDYRGHQSVAPLKRGMIDRFLMQLAITVGAQDGELDETYHVLDNARTRKYHIISTETEEVETRAGSFKALRIERADPDQDKTLMMWLAPELDYLPVKIEQQKRNEEALRLVLTGIERSKKPLETKPAAAGSGAPKGGEPATVEPPPGN